MNFGLMISCKVEEKLELIERGVEWNQAKEAQAYEECLKEALDEHGRAWADGNIRVGDYILLSEYLPHMICYLDLTDKRYLSRLGYTYSFGLSSRCRL